MRHVISVLLQNEVGALTRMTGLFSTRGYNIETLNVAPTDDPLVSRVTLVIAGSDAAIAQLNTQLAKLLDVVNIHDMTLGEHFERELAIVKLKLKTGGYEKIRAIAEEFGADILDDAQVSCTVQLTGRPSEIDKFVAAVAQVGELAALSGDVPVLALNQIDSTEPIDLPLYQFGLAPEDEARQVAERLVAEGRDQVIALVPDSPWGARVMAAFAEHFSALGGTLLTTGRYAPDSVDFKGPIQETLNLDDSRNRHRALERLLGQKLQYEARRRQDVEAFFLLAFPEQARLIRPQLRFYRAADIPVFSTSHVFSANPNAALDGDMEGLMFCDMPWVLDQAGDWSERRERLAALWPERSNRYQRLFALGFDAYEVVPWLDTLTLPGFGYFPGATGVLTLDNTRALHRTLEWAQFRRGVPQQLQNRPQTTSMEGQHEPQGYGGLR